MSNYVSVVEADLYFSTKLNATAWNTSTDAEKLSALTEATELINNLPFKGEKTDDEQVNEFPRGGDTAVPSAINKACCEIAIALLDGIEIETELMNINLESSKVEGVQSTYNRSFVPEYISARIPSAVAWSYLKGYVEDMLKIRISRVS